MRTIIAILVGVGLLAASTPAIGGSLGDFKESYEETEDAAEDDDDDDDDDGDSGWDDYHDDPDCYDCTSSEPLDDVLLALWSPFLGYLPGDEFSLGRAPYHGRGDPVDSSSLPELEGLTVESGWPEAYATAEPDRDPDSRYFQVTLRANGVATTRVDAAGTELFGKLSSTYMPGIAMSYQYTAEFDSDETLTIGYLVYEPNVFTEHATLSWTIGAVTLGDQATLDELGLTTGMALEVFPSDPVFLDLRASVHVFENVRMVDARVGAGVFVTDQIGVELNLRHLNIIDGTSLTMAGVGLRTYLGF